MDLPLIATPQPDAGLRPDKAVSITPDGLAATLKHLRAGKVWQY